MTVTTMNINKNATSSTVSERLLISRAVASAANLSCDSPGRKREPTHPLTVWLPSLPNRRAVPRDVVTSFTEKERESTTGLECRG